MPNLEKSMNSTASEVIIPSTDATGVVEAAVSPSAGQAAQPEEAEQTEQTAKSDIAAAQDPTSRTKPKADRLRTAEPVLEKLFALYPHLFGVQFLPLKLGIFQELLARHPEDFKRDTLKAALGIHTRSTRYLQSVADGNPRHDLDGAVVEAVAPEHVYLSLLELFRRRQARSREDLRPKFCAQLVAAFVASGLSRQDYLLRVQNSDAEATLLLEEALAMYAEKTARIEALLTAFESSGKTRQEFADMYGINPRDLDAAIGQQRRLGAQAVLK